MCFGAVTAFAVNMCAANYDGLLYFMKTNETLMNLQKHTFENLLPRQWTYFHRFYGCFELNLQHFLVLLDRDLKSTLVFMKPFLCVELFFYFQQKYLE